MEPTDATLTRYLLGDLPHEQAEALDERSVVDAAFADRLRAIEQDLADAVARGELSAEDRQRWNQTAGASAVGRDELLFARALAAHEQRRASASAHSTPAPATRWTPRTLIGLAAAAAVLLALAVGYRTVRTPSPAPAVTANGPIAPAPSPSPAPPPTSVPVPSAAAPSFVALTLVPPTRSVTHPPDLTIPPGTNEARVTLQLEPNEYRRFAVALRDLRSRSIAWQQADLTPRMVDGHNVLPLTISVSTLHAGRFVFELRGIAAAHSEPIGTYPLTIRFNAQ